MSRYFAVRRVRGPRRDAARPMRAQDGWAEHAAFMDALAAEGFVMLGGLLGEGERRAMLIVESADAAAVRARLAQDPWSGGRLEIEEIEPWTILLDARQA